MEQLDYMLRRNPVLLRIDIENAPVAQEVHIVGAICPVVISFGGGEGVGRG